MVFCVLLVIPLLIAVVGFIFFKGVTWKEFLVQVGAQVIVAGVSAAIVSCANTVDVEVWNGAVASKEKSWVPCSHSYSCNCRQVCTGSGKDQTCSEQCDTCYEHLNDWDWDVHTSNGETITISRVDRRGSQEPPRWTSVRVGDPTAQTHLYTNYIKAAPGSLFRHQGLAEKYKDRIPVYPQEVFDYYRLNRFVPVAAPVLDAIEWDADLSKLNADLGQSTQSNTIVVLVKDLPPEYFYALEEAWLGGKKNDIILVIAVDDNLKPQWTNVMAWTSEEIFKVKLHDDIMDEPIVTRDAVMTDLRTNIANYYVRKPMKDFEYLKANITPSTTEWLVAILFGLLVASGLVYFFHKENVLDDDIAWFKRRGLRL